MTRKIIHVLQVIATISLFSTFPVYLAISETGPTKSNALLTQETLLSGDTLRSKDYSNLEEIIVVWKTHCDIGYTHPVEQVLNYYRNQMMDRALKLIDESSKLPDNQHFVWMLPAWVMGRILDEKQDSARLVHIEKAITNKRLIWHGLPFTFESEAGDLEELVRGLGSGTRLSKRFGQPLATDAKLTDMPSQAWVLPTLLANAGIKFIHIGVNPWSPNPLVPHLFWWEGPDGSRVLTGYSFHNYSWDPIPPAGWPYKTWLCMQVTGDNSGPPSPQSVQDALDKIHKELPGVKVRFGRPSDFADAILKENNSTIPVIHKDMPDTWTHGQMSMPVATQIHRRAAPAMVSLGLLATELKTWKIADTDITSALETAYQEGSLFTEHTWGIAGPAFGTPDHETWKKDLAAGKYKEQLATFEWKAEYANKAWKITKDGIETRLIKLAQATNASGPRVAVFNPLPWPRDGIAFFELQEGEKIPFAVRNLSGGQKIAVTLSGRTISFPVTAIPAGGYNTYSLLSGKPNKDQDVRGDFLETSYFKVKFDTKRGGLSSLMYKKDGRELASTRVHALGQFIHERFSKKEVDAFLKAYCHVYFEWYGFPLYDFNKPKLDSTLHYTCITPGNWTLHITREAAGDRAVLTTRHTQGLAESYSLTYFFPTNQPYVDITWKVEGKTPELIPEGGWICLPLKIQTPSFRVSHISAPFNPEKDLIAGSNHHLFSIDYGISVRDGNNGPGAGVASSDLPLWSIDEPGLWKYSTDFVPKRAELFANLYNNQWNTNYPLWIDGSWSASLRLWPINDKESEEASLFTPSWEYRQRLLTGSADGSAGVLPVMDKGLTLSRKGIRVTAFCPNPDAEKGVTGTLIRIWEQAGQSGETVITLPRGCNATQAQPVNLRGEKAGSPVPVKEGKFKCYLGAYAPASFVINWQ